MIREVNIDRMPFFSIKALEECPRNKISLPIILFIEGTMLCIIGRAHHTTIACSIILYLVMEDTIFTTIKLKIRQQSMITIFTHPLMVISFLQSVFSRPSPNGNPSASTPTPSPPVTPSSSPQHNTTSNYHGTAPPSTPAPPSPQSPQTSTITPSTDPQTSVHTNTNPPIPWE